MNHTIPAALFVILSLLIFSGPLQAQQYAADHYYIAPPEVEADEIEKHMYDRRYPLPESVVKQYTSKPMMRYVNDMFAGASPELARHIATVPEHYVAVNQEVRIPAEALFGPPEARPGGYVFLAEIASTDAHALRLQVDLMGLRDDEELWVLDAGGRAAFGPFGTGNATHERGHWLPVTDGDTLVLAVHSPRAVAPLLQVNTLAHFYRPLLKQNRQPLGCNIPISEETNPVAREIATGVGLIVVPVGNAQATCSATLVYAPHTAPPGVPAPYLITAWHCFGDSADYSGMEVFWDYRASEADGTVPDITTVPRTSGAELIAQNSVLDAAFLKLTSPVEVGEYGRAWAGWDTATPAQGASVQCIHFPIGAPMKKSQGRVTDTGVQVCMNTLCSTAYEQQVQVYWNAGVTEEGSSGSALLETGKNYRITGMLSNGNRHSCTDTSNNYDNYASFAYFFPQIGCYLESGYRCEAPYEKEEEAPYEKEESRCCVMRMVGLKLDSLNHLRRLRDETLMHFPLGKRVIEEYYTLSAQAPPWLKQDVLFRALIEVTATLGAAWGAAL